MEALYQAVRIIAVYLLFISVLLEILQNSPFKTYIRLFAGLLLVLLMVHAIIPFFFADFDMEVLMNQIVHTDDFMEQLEEAQKAGEEQMKENVLAEFTKELEVILERFGYTMKDVKIELFENYQIETIELILEQKENSNELEEVKEEIAAYFSIALENIVIQISSEIGGIKY